MSFHLADIRIFLGYEVVAAMTAVLLLDRENRIICCFLAALLHELGHLLMMKLCGVRIRGLKLRLFDVLIEADEPDIFRSDVLITLGGVLSNFLFALIFAPIDTRLCLPNLALGVFNLLPVMSLDGGHLLQIILARRFSPRVCETTVRVCTFIVFVPLFTAGVYLLFHSGYNYSLLVIALYVLVLLLLKK